MKNIMIADAIDIRRPVEISTQVIGRQRFT